MLIRKYFLIILSLVGVQGYSQDSIDFISGIIDIDIDPVSQMVNGKVVYNFNASDRTDSVMVNIRDLNIELVTINRRKVPHRIDGNQLIVYRKIKSGKTYKLSITYSATPGKAVYFIGWKDSIAHNNQVWTQGQGKYSSHWVPSFDDMSEKVIFNLEISFDKSYDVIANGRLIKAEIQDSLKTWKYSMEKPMSSYLLAFAIGYYDNNGILSSSKIPIDLYSYSGDTITAEPTYRFTKEIFDFLEDEIGVPYPWQNYKQVPARDFLYAGMENTGATIFSDSYAIDAVAFKDKNYVEVNAHELAHQWFGNMVTEVGAKDHWLHEGFATYYSLLARKKVFGNEHFYWKLFESAKALGELEGEALTDPSAGSLTFYEKGAWACAMLREAIGDRSFRKGVQNYLREYAYSNATIADFLRLMQNETEVDLKDFENLWLNTKDFPVEQAKQYLMRNSESIRAWNDLRWELTTSGEENEIIIKRYWDKTPSIYFRRQVLSKFVKYFSVPKLRDILQNGDPELKKTIAIYLERIPPELKGDFEALLTEPGYVAVENALFKLWIYFPDERARYLELSRGLVGLPNKNVRILWLFLAVLTNDFDSENDRKIYKNELFGYTAPNYPYEVRQTAFTVITEVFDLPEKNLKDLMNASVHHVWQFRNFARRLLTDVLKDEQQKSRLNGILGELKEEEQVYLRKQLEGK